jgi:hypothetical protein
MENVLQLQQEHKVQMEQMSQEILNMKSLQAGTAVSFFILNTESEKPEQSARCIMLGGVLTVILYKFVVVL